MHEDKRPVQILVGIGLMAALTAIGAFLRIPLPYVPITLQTSFVYLSGILLGPKYGMFSQVKQKKLHTKHSFSILTDIVYMLLDMGILKCIFLTAIEH